MPLLSTHGLRISISSNLMDLLMILLLLSSSIPPQQSAASSLQQVPSSSLMQSASIDEVPRSLANSRGVDLFDGIAVQASEAAQSILIVNLISKPPDPSISWLANSLGIMANPNSSLKAVVHDRARKKIANLLARSTTKDSGEGGGGLQPGLLREYNLLVPNKKKEKKNSGRPFGLTSKEPPADGTASRSASARDSSGSIPIKVRGLLVAAVEPGKGQDAAATGEGDLVPSITPIPPPPSPSVKGKGVA